MPAPRLGPAVLPSLGFALGCALAPHLCFAPVGLLAGLAAAACARGGASGRLLLFLALGLLRAGIEPQVEGRTNGIQLDGALTAVVRVVGAWSGGADGFAATARAELEAVRQGTKVVAARQPVWLDWRAGAPPPPPGSVLRARGRLARPPGYANRVEIQGGAPRLAVKSARLVETLAGPGWSDRLAGRMRLAVSRIWPPGDRRPGVALARAFLVGDSEGLPEDWRRGFRRSGLAHLLAVSGFNVSLVVAAALLLAAPLPRSLRFALTLGLVAAYSLLVGPQAPIARAAQMAILAGLALLWLRPPVAAHALALAGLVALARDPGLISELSFQLTFTATAALVVGAPALARRWSALGSATSLLLAAPVAAQWATLPWAIARFHQVQLFSAPYNLIAAAWAGSAMLLVVGATGVGIAVPAAIPLCRAAMDGIALPLDLLATPGFHLGVLPVAGLSPAVVAALGLATAALWWPRRLGLPLLAAAAAGSLIAAPVRRPDEATFSLTALDVGQGDATLLRDADVAILVDGGGFARGDFGARVLLPALAGEGVAAIDVAVVSHPDLDHCGGLADLADYLPIREVWAPPGWELHTCTRRLMVELGARRAVLVAGDVRRRGGWRFEVLAPSLDSGARTATTNDQSLVLRAEAGGRSVLLTGDLEEQGELELVARRRTRLPVDWLKLGHHGSATSSVSPLLRYAAPRLAWISAGRGNAFGHPAAAVLDRLRDHAVPVRRTDRDGLIRIEWRRDGWWRLELPRSPAPSFDR